MDATLSIYTDGGCHGNPGKGGWAYVMVTHDSQGEKIIAEKQGGEKETTNNRMELTAVIEALRELKITPDLPRKIEVYTDSQYVQKGISEWIHNWKRNSWKTAGKQPVKNKDLWVELDSLSQGFSIDWKWVKGHAGNIYNERCDSMTQSAIASLR